MKSGKNTALKPIGLSSDDEDPESMMIQINHTQPTKDAPTSCNKSKVDYYTESSISDNNEQDLVYIVDNK